MRRYLPLAVLVTIAALPAQAQVVRGVSQTGPTGDTTTVFTITPPSGISASDYVKGSADALNYQIAAAQLVAERAQRDDVKAFAQQVLAHARSQQQTLYAGLTNADRKITRPSSTLSSDRKANIDLLRNVPRAGFDTLYLKQQIDAAPAIWALQKGYSADGTDPTLKQIAVAAVPALEQDYRAAKALIPAGVADAR